MIFVAMVAAGAVLVGLQGWLGRRRSVWFGALMPSAWLTLSVAMGVAGHLTGPRDCIMVVFGMIVLVRIWAEGRPKAVSPHPTPADGRTTEPVADSLPMS